MQNKSQMDKLISANTTYFKREKKWKNTENQTHVI